MQAEGHEHGADGEVKPLDPSRRKFLVDPFLNLENQSSLRVNEPCSDLVTSSNYPQTITICCVFIGEIVKMIMTKCELHEITSAQLTEKYLSAFLGSYQRTYH